jgi:hypothetical protein
MVVYINQENPFRQTDDSVPLPLGERVSLTQLLNVLDVPAEPAAERTNFFEG